MSGFYFLLIVIPLSALCVLDGKPAGHWIAGGALALNVALIFFEWMLRRSARTGAKRQSIFKRRGASSFFDL